MDNLIKEKQLIKYYTELQEISLNPEHKEYAKIMLERITN